MELLSKLNVLELRNYVIQPTMVEHFIDYFEANFIASQENVGMYVLGQFRVIDQPDRFVWMRGFVNMQTRREGLEGFYYGPVWQSHRNTANGMLVDSDQVHLLRPLGNMADLTCGRTAESIAAELASGTLSPQTGVVAVDFYRAEAAKADQRDRLINQFTAQVVPLYERESVQMRGTFIAEMRENDFPRLPVIQNAHELVVVTAYENAAACQEKRAALANAVDQAIGSLLAAPTETILLSPTLRSALRW